jgi:hypothetical protein
MGAVMRVTSTTAVSADPLRMPTVTPIASRSSSIG